jgi:hypothetical protein
MAKGYNFERLVERFVAINANLKRLEVIRVLCVLGQGCIVWGYHDKDLQFQAAEFMREDLFRPIAPGLLKQRDKPVAWYAFITTLLRHLYSSVLAAEAIGSYGLELPIAVPDNTRHYIDPDTAWMETLDLEWKGDEKIVRAPGEYGALSALHVAENEAIKRQLDAKHKLSKIVTNISEKEKDGKTSRRRKAR